jgi:uncharacterized protein (TIGR02118 family)
MCLHRRRDLSREEFHRHWRDEHAPLARGVADALGIQRYVQLHAATGRLSDALTATRDAPEPFDGVAELWFDNEEAMVAAATSPEGSAAAQLLLDDERRFVDHSRSPILLGLDFVVVQ